MKKPADPTKILSVFAQYGFRRVSMNDIAQAAGLSRQSIYNQYGSKENVLDCAVNTFLSEVVAQAKEVLQTPEANPIDTVLNAFQAIIGDHLWILQDSPHGPEILNMSIASAKRADTDYDALFAAALARFLRDRGLAPTDDTAADIAFALDVAARGLMRQADSAQDFRNGMTRVLRAFLTTGGDAPSPAQIT